MGLTLQVPLVCVCEHKNLPWLLHTQVSKWASCKERWTVCRVSGEQDIAGVSVMAESSSGRLSSSDWLS